MHRQGQAADHARAKVFLDALDRSGGGGLEEARLKLLTVGAVIGPVAGSRDPLAGADHSGVANNGDEIAVPPRLDPNDAKTVVGILVGDALNQPGQHLSLRWLRFRLHDVRRAGLVTETSGPRKTC